MALNRIDAGGRPAWNSAFCVLSSAYWASGRPDCAGTCRWLSPDPLGGDITNPQSLNRYSYVLNNPETLIDPLGLQPGDDGFEDTGDPCSDPFFAISNAECGSPGGFDIGFGFPFPFPPPLPPPVLVFASGIGSAEGATARDLGDSFRSPVPCVNESALLTALTAQLAAALGVPPSTIRLTQLGNGQGGAYDFSVTNPLNPGQPYSPTNIPYINNQVSQRLHPGVHSQFWYPAPKDSVPGLGRMMHVLFNRGPLNPSTGLPQIENAQIHVDIGSPLTKTGSISPIGAGVHLFADWLTVRAISTIEGCEVKFR